MSYPPPEPSNTHFNLIPALKSRGGGGSSIVKVKVPSDVPPARVFFFGLLA